MSYAGFTDEDRNLFKSYSDVTTTSADKKALEDLNKKSTSYLKEWNTDQDIDANSRVDPESGLKIDPNRDRKAIEEGRIERGEQEWGKNPDGTNKIQPKASEQLKISNKQPPTFAQGAEVLAQAFNTLDMLTGGQDQLQMASNDLSIGSNWDPNMYIG